MGTLLGTLAVLLIWLAAPFVELGIIIYLAVSNDRYKKKIKELTGQERRNAALAYHNGYAGEERTGPSSDQESSQEEDIHDREQAQLEGRTPADPQAQIAGWTSTYPQHQGMAQPMYQPPVPAKEPKRRFSSQLKVNVQSNLGTLALIIGVIFVVIAGVIFATTTWHALPAVAKALLVLAAAGLFFGASYLAEEFLHIHRTGNAFYLLGSIFLFLSCLATAYFKLLGPAFILDGTNRWRVLWVGSLVTELALFGGLKRFRDRIYTQTVLWGMTVSMCFMAKAFRADWAGLISGMMLYAAALVVWKDHLETRALLQEGQPEKLGFRELLLDGFRHFVPIHFWVFGAFTALQSLLGIGWHWSLGDRFFWSVFSDGDKIAPITLLRVLAMAALTGGIGLLTRKHVGSEREGQWKLLSGLAVVLTIQYTAFYVPVKETMQFFLAAAALYLWLWTGRRGDRTSGGQDGPAPGRKEGIGAQIGILSQSRTFGGDMICTAVLFLNVFTLFLLSLLPSEGADVLLAASGAILLLAGAFGLWGKEKKEIRMAIPCILWLLTITVYMLHGRVSWLESVPGAWILADYEWVLFLFLAGAALWDIVRRDVFCLSIATIGTLAQLVYYCKNDRTLPFALLLAVCFALRGKGMERLRERPMSDVDLALCPLSLLPALSKVYLLAGCYFTMGYVTEILFFRMMAVNLCFGLLQVFSQMGARRRVVAALEGGLEKEVQGTSLFWELCGCGAFLLTMLAFYRGLGERITTVRWMLVLCVLTFYGYYIWFYRGKHQWSHLLATGSFLPLPYFLADLDWVGTDQLYAGVAVMLLLSGVLFRCRSRILEKAEDVENGWRVDWYHMAAAFLLVAMIADGSRGWGFWYILLLALYFLQYAAIRPLREAACFISASLLAVAIWEQPFIQWPKIVELEIRLVPVVLLLLLLKPIFGRSRTVSCLQTLGGSVCLALLCLDALRTNELVDALLLEGICLAVFIWAQLYKNSLWARISGIIILLVALFMTKSFWFSISWWVYLLVVGVGLIIFAAVNEKKKR